MKILAALKFRLFWALALGLVTTGFSQEKFVESLDVLQLLLKDKEVSYKGKFYNFEPITIMPRPISNPIQMMIAAMDLNSIKDAYCENT